MFVATLVRLQFGVVGRTGAEELADAQHQLERAGFLVDRLQAIEQLLELAMHIAADQTDGAAYFEVRYTRLRGPHPIFVLTFSVWHRPLRSKKQ